MKRRTHALWFSVVVVLGCTRQSTSTPTPAATTPSAPQPDVVNVVADSGVRSAAAPDRAAIPDGTGWSCTVEDVDGGLRDDTCQRTAEACESMLRRVNASAAENAALARRLGVQMPTAPRLRCLSIPSAHCFTYVDTRDSQTHWDCSRTEQRCEVRRRYFREENQRGESVVRYRSISECEATQ